MRLFAIAEQVQQHQEHVDEVQVQRKCAHEAFLCSRFAAVTFVVRRLDALCVVRGQTSEDQHTDHGDRELHRRAFEEDVNDARQNNTDQAHHQERAHARQVFFGRIAEQAETCECARRNKEHACDARPCVGQKDR